MADLSAQSTFEFRLGAWHGVAVGVGDCGASMLCVSAALRDLCLGPA